MFLGIVDCIGMIGLPEIGTARLSSSWGIDTTELVWRVGDARSWDNGGGIVCRFFGVGEPCNGSGLSVSSLLILRVDLGVNGDGVGGLGKLHFMGVVITFSCFSTPLISSSAWLCSLSSFSTSCTSSVGAS